MEMTNSQEKALKKLLKTHEAKIIKQEKLGTGNILVKIKSEHYTLIAVIGKRGKVTAD